MQLICASPDFDPARRGVEVFLTCAMRRLDGGFEGFGFEVEAPRHAIVRGQAEAPILWLDRVLRPA
jgi:hypothetical protein